MRRRRILADFSYPCNLQGKRELENARRCTIFISVRCLFIFFFEFCTRPFFTKRQKRAPSFPFLIFGKSAASKICFEVILSVSVFTINKPVIKLLSTCIRPWILLIKKIIFTLQHIGAFDALFRLSS